MSGLRDSLVSLTLLGLVGTGPAAVAAYLLSGEPADDSLTLAATGSGDPAAIHTATGAGGDSTGVPVLAGVLYTRGTAVVNWNGVSIPVTDGSYAYLGGEVVSTGPGDMGVLQLDGDDSVYLCPGSRMSVGRGEDGAYAIRISQGGARFAFAPGSRYRIEANQGVLSPARDSDSQPTVVEVAVFANHPGGVMCGFSNSMNVAGFASRGGSGPVALGTAGPGEIIDLARALRDEAASTGTPVIMQPIPMPASVQRWLQSNAPYPPAPGTIGYLCRCEELKRYAEADGIPDAAIPPRMSPPDGEALTALLATDNAPPVALPPPRPAELAVPDGPLDIDSAVLPVAAAPPVTVPPPLVPATGSGGGFTSTPS